jgi:type IV secretion system protein VirB3
MDPLEKPPVEYMSYNGLGRSAMIWGIPYMALLFIGSGSLLTAVLLALVYGPAGFLFLLLAAPVLIFLKMISATDGQALRILMLEAKWVAIKAMTGTARHFGGTLTIAPTSYGRQPKHVRRYFRNLP